MKTIEYYCAVNGKHFDTKENLKTYHEAMIDACRLFLNSVYAHGNNGNEYSLFRIYHPFVESTYCENLVYKGHLKEILVYVFCKHYTMDQLPIDINYLQILSDTYLYNSYNGMGKRFSLKEFTSIERSWINKIINCNYSAADITRGIKKHIEYITVNGERFDKLISAQTYENMFSVGISRFIHSIILDKNITKRNINRVNNYLVTKGADIFGIYFGSPIDILMYIYFKQLEKFKDYCSEYYHLTFIKIESKNFKLRDEHYTYIHNKSSEETTTWINAIKEKYKSELLSILDDKH